MENMADFKDTEFDRWDNTAETDSHIIIRESSPRQVRERWVKIRLRVHEMGLEHDLSVAHITEELDCTLVDAPIASLPPKNLSKWGDLFDTMGVWFCQHTHPKLMYRPGDQHSTCPVCGRKYAVPFAVVAKLDPDAYINTTVFAMPVTPTVQCVCRNGLQGNS